MKIKLSIVLLIPLLLGCITIEVKKLSDTPGISSCYHLVSEEDKKSLIFLTPDQKLDTSQVNDGKIYAVSAPHLLDIVSYYDSCVIYLWSWGCSSEHCILPSACEEFCKKNNYKLFVLTSYYKFPTMQILSSGLDYPLLVVNHLYYGTDKYREYMKKFEYEIAGGDYFSRKKNWGKRFMIFKKGEFAGAVDEIYKLK